MTLALSGAALAYQPTLTPQQTAQAVKEGNAMLQAGGGYVWGPYLLHTYNEGIRLRPDSPEVDGVAMGTPYERLRYNAYLSAYQDQPLTSQQASTLARQVAGQLTFLIYSHSPLSIDEEEEQWQLAYDKNPSKPRPDREPSYLDLYKTATLTVDGTALSAAPQVDGPYRDDFTLPNGRADYRFLGVIRYTFDLSGVKGARQASLRFTDSRGKVYTQAIDLSAVR